MDLLDKIQLLLNSSARSALPRRERRSPLDEREAQLLAEIREAVAAVQAQERRLAQQLKTEQARAEQAEDRAQQRIHRHRAAELERELEQESIQAINLEEKLAALEEKLALAKEAVDKQAREAARRDQAATIAMGGEAEAEEAEPPPEETASPDFSEDEPDLAARKSRLSRNP